MYSGVLFKKSIKQFVKKNLFKKYLIIIMVFISINIYCQQPESACVYLEHPVSDYLNLRFGIELPFVPLENIYCNYELGSIELQKGKDNDKIHVSANWIFPFALLIPRPYLFAVIPIFLTNVKIHLLYFTNNFSLYVRQKTDYFLFYSVNKINTESIVGFNYQIGKFNLSIGFNYPWTSGYASELQKYKPYISVSLLAVAQVGD